jgi:D-alanyl-D-alanine carboxypeptidase
MAAAAAALPSQPKAEPAKVEQAKPEPAPLTSGVIQSQPMSIMPGSAEPMKPVKVKTVQVKAGGAMKLAAAGPMQPAPPVTSAVPPARPEVAETSSAVVAKADIKPEPARTEPARTEIVRPEVVRVELPRQPAGHGTGNGVLGVLPASGAAPAASQAMAYADPARGQPQPAQAVQQNGAIKAVAPAVTRSGWIIQVGALESEGEARQRIEAAKGQARGMLNKADSFTEPVVAKDNRKLFRARFAGLERDQAEAVCRALKRADMSCITVRN